MAEQRLLGGWCPPSTVRKVRRAAGAHKLSRFNYGGDTAVASCVNGTCTVMVEIHGRDDWRFIRLGDEDCTGGRVRR